MLDQKIRDKLKKVVGEAGVKDGGEVTEFTVDGILPQAVVFPNTAAEVEGVVIGAIEEGLSLIPWGGGTQIGLGAPPRRLDLVISTSRLDRMVDLDHENMTMTVEAGMRLGALQEQLRQVAGGFFLPLDPPCTEEVTIGGAVATNASGPRRLLYGTLRDLVLGVEVVIPEEMERGCKICAGGKTAKNVSGYDMSKLYIGSLGTLAIIVSVTLKMLPLPEDRGTILGRFANTEASWTCAQALLESQLIPTCIEVYNGETASFLPTDGKDSDKTVNWMAVGLEGVKEAVEREVAQIEKMLRAEGAADTVALKGSDEVAYWSQYGGLAREVRARKGWSIGLKIGVPISQVQEISKMLSEESAKIDLPFCQLSHAGNGIVYTHMPLDESEYGAKEELLVQLVTALRNQIHEMEGSLVVEYAPAVFKEKVDVWGEAGGVFPVMERLKKEFDPRNMLNPGRFVGGI